MQGIVMVCNQMAHVDTQPAGHYHVPESEDPTDVVRSFA